VATCCDTRIENTVDPQAYAANTHIMDSDSPTFHQAMNGEYAKQYIKAMKLEVLTPIQQQSWSMVPCTPSLRVLKGYLGIQVETAP
jgi:hypothetical protein